MAMLSNQILNCAQGSSVNPRTAEQIDDLELLFAHLTNCLKRDGMVYVGDPVQSNELLRTLGELLLSGADHRRAKSM